MSVRRRREWLPLLGVLVLGTAVTLVVTALVFVAASRMVRQSVREERP